MSQVVDLFAGGLGGFGHAGRALGYSTLGIEWCKDACATREAAGLATLQADAAALDPLDFAPIVGLTGGPPCQAFSNAGKGIGRASIADYHEAIADMGRGIPVNWEEVRCEDGRADLVLEPLRWALALRPRWVACEQVEPVLPLWEAMAAALRSHGYWTWTGICSAECYGVPQTRRRAFMLASLDGPVSRPPATHQRYIAPRRREEATDGMFVLPEPARIVAPEDRELLPWVSMAQALSWPETYGGGTWKVGPPGSHIDPPMRWKLRANSRANATARGADEPAPTITGGHDHNERAWVLRSGQSVAGEGRAERPVSEPSLSIISRTDLCSWVESRPAPTIVGTRRSDQGIVVGRQLPEGEDRSVGGWSDVEGAAGKAGNAVRVSLAEALALQSFDPDYPVQGSKSKQFEQVGNAIPRLLALAVLQTVVGERAAVAA